MANRPRQLQVKRIIFSNPDNIQNVTLEWKYDKATGYLHLRIKQSDMTMGSGFTNICEALKEYNRWYS
jgi:hypothetical protein